MEEVEKKLQTCLVTCGDMVSDKKLEISQYLVTCCRDTASTLQQDFRMPQASWATQWTSFLLGNEARSLHKQWCRDPISSVNCVCYCSTVAFSKWPFYPQSVLFWHNEEKRAIAAHTIIITVIHYLQTIWGNTDMTWWYALGLLLVLVLPEFPKQNMY